MARIIENEFIYLKDGVRLSSRIWLPEDACESNPVPAIFEFLPYRKRDGTTMRDEIHYQHFSQHGYAGVRVDMRGSGDSTGVPQDEYVVQEQDDAVECIEWISKQPWCTGNVGMMGISWGGFNSLQVAARQPRALKAIISLCSTDDRFSDDIHFKGGSLLMDNMRWATYMEWKQGLPPDPLISEDWQQLWMDRLKNLDSLSYKWLQHQTRDEYWKHGSICENYLNIKIPTLLIGGYADGYTNIVKRTYENLKCPKRAIIGPWVHLYTDISTPKPLWGFCNAAIGWWNQWLKESGAPGAPGTPVSEKLIAFVQKNVEVPCQEEVDGRWIENPVSELKTYFLEEGKLGDMKGEAVIEVSSSEMCGKQTVMFYTVALDDMPEEQSEDDALSCVFETAPFDLIVDFVGRPCITLSVASDKPVANVFIRLCLVNKNGDSRLIGYTGINLNHENNHSLVTNLKPDVFKKVEAELDFIGESAQPGYKLRLAISSAYFPMFVPNPEHVTLSLDLSGCQLQMPVLVTSSPLAEPIPEVTECKPHPTIMKTPASFNRQSYTDQGKLFVTTTSKSGRKEYCSHGLNTETTMNTTESISTNDPTSAKLEVVYNACWSRGDNWKVDTLYTMDFTMDKENFFLYETREAQHNGEVVFKKEYKNKVKRVGH